MRAQQIFPCDLTEIRKAVFEDGLLKVMPYDFWKNFERNEVMYFMHQHGVYVLPTVELIAWLHDNTVGESIEIGSGTGSICRALGIKGTDNYMQAEGPIAEYYKMLGNPPIQYPAHIEKIDAHEAIMKYSPDTVIGAFITHKHEHGMAEGNSMGVQEEFVLQNVKRYINIGNKVTHASKPILGMDHKEHQFEWLITRAVNQKENVIFVFEGFKR